MNSAERHEARYQRRKAAREAKRRKRLDVYDNFDRVASIPALIRANFDSRKGVMWKASVARYNAHFLKFAVMQSRDLYTGKFKCSGFFVFWIVERGKRRHVHSLHYAERVIRRSFCINALVPILSSGLIYDNGASLKGKGVSFAVNRCAVHLHQYFRETGSNEGYVLIIDFKGYFDHILHKPLMEIIDRYITDPALNRVVKMFIAASDEDKAEDEKGKGLYIGPEDSQIYAISYPSRIDHQIKDGWGLRFYARYNDDSYIMLKDKDKLLEYKRQLFQMYDALGIIPNQKKTQVVKISRGFTYLKTKYFLTDTGKVIMKPDHDSIVRERRKLKKLKRFYDQGIMTIQQVSQQYMSWRGSILKKDAYRSVEHMDGLFFSLFGVRPWKKKKGRKKETWTKKENALPQKSQH